MIRAILLTTAGLCLTALGLVGLIVPILPGLLFLLLAACCFAAVHPAMNERLQRHPALQRARRRWRSSDGLGLMDRIRLGFWLAADAILTSTPGSDTRRAER